MATKTIDSATRDIVALLGGATVMTGSIREPQDMQTALRKGFPYASYEAVVRNLNLGAGDLARIMGIATRTLARRKTGQNLSPIESDRLYRIVKVTRRAIVVLGSLEHAREWLVRTNLALGNVSPISLLDTEIGEQQVEEVLDRISLGVYS